jgi:hypothetical protein
MSTQSIQFLKRSNAVADTAGMSDVEAAWVREHVWTRTMRQTYKSTPAYFRTCACQWGRCGHCDRGDHKACTHGPRGYQPFPSPEGYITNAQQQVLALPTWFDHPERSATGWHRSAAAMVWLADRRCIWCCPCECRSDEPVRPQPIVLVSTRERRRQEPAGQESLFEVMAP